MALAYLLSPTFQFVNTAGRPLTGGYLEVYIAGSRDKYYCASDFNGTLHPFRIPLDSLGASVVLADDGHSYDVYAYNRYGGLSMSRYNVSPGGGGGGSVGTITSLDGSIIVTPTDDGVDLRVNSKTTTVMRCSATELTGDGDFQFAQVQRDGQGARVTSHNVIIDEGWWHYDATVRIRWQGSAESTQQVGLYSSNGSDTMDFDLSYPHSETVRLGGEIKALADGTQFAFGVTGIQAGMVAELVDFGIHTITSGGGAGGQYYQGTGILIDEADRIISVDPNYVQETLSAGTGIVLEDNEISVDTDVIQEKLSAGSNIVIEGNTISATAEPQLQANWNEDDSSSVQYIQNKPDLSVYATTQAMNTALAGKQDTISDLDAIRSGAQAGSTAVQPAELADYQEKLTAGSNISISANNEISATDTTYSAGTGLDLTGTTFSVDTTTIATKSDLPIQQQLVPGYSLPADAGKVLTAGSTTYWSSLSDYVTDTELSTILQGYQTALTAGSNIQISNGTISATDTTYTAGNGLALSGTEFAIDTSVVATKSDIPEDEIFYVDVANPDYDTALAAYNAGKTLVLKGDSYTGYLCRYTPMDGLVFAYNLPWTVAGVATATQVGYMAMRKVTATGETYWHGFSSCAIPTATREDSGKVLTVSGSNVAAWTSLSDYVTDTELSTILQGYQEALTAGSNIQISNGTISATDTTYSAGSGLDLTGTAFSVDTTAIATKTDLAAYTPTASLGAVALSNDYDDLSNKPTIPVVPDMKSLVAGNNVSITEDATTVTISASGAPQLQANWNEQNSSSVQYIQNKPTIPVLPSTKDLVAGSNITITESSNDVTVACSITVGTVTV